MEYWLRTKYYIYKGIGLNPTNYSPGVHLVNNTLSGKLIKSTGGHHEEQNRTYLVCDEIPSSMTFWMSSNDSSLVDELSNVTILQPLNKIKIGE